MARLLHREDQCNGLSNFITSKSVTGMVLVGPDGTGKSLICKQVLENIRHIKISCGGFHKQKHLFRTLLQEISISEGIKLPPQLPKAITEFNDLAKFLAITLISSTPRSIIILFEDLQDAYTLDTDLPRKLICLPSYVNAPVKVIATMRPVNSPANLPCLVMPCKPYTEREIVSILNKIGSIHITMLADCVKDGSCSDHSLLLARFEQLVQEAVLKLTLHTRHIGELWTSVLTMWRLHNQLGLANQLPVPDNLNNGSKEAGSTVTETETEAATAGADTERARGGVIAVTSKSVGEAYKALQSIPMRRTHQLVSMMSKQGQGCPARVLPDSLPQRPVNLDTLRGSSYVLTMPLTLKYLVLSAFIASNNPKSSDLEIFAGAASGKRKRVNAGQDDMATIDRNAVGVTNRSFALERLLTLFTQISSMGGVDKLGSGHRAAIALGRPSALADSRSALTEINDKYGDSQLFAQIRTLESQQLLLRCVGWTVDNPIYTSTIGIAMASDIASSLSMNVREIMHVPK